jgi:hypothetical protein
VKIPSTIVNREDAILLVPEMLSGAAVGAPGVEVVSDIALSKKLSDAKVEEL